MIKICNNCKLEKDINDYHINKDGYLGKQSFCKICKSNYRKNHYKQNKNKTLQANKLWRKNNIEKIRDIQNKWHRKNAKYYQHLSKLYQTRKSHACPKWLSKKDKQLLKEIYNQRPEGYHVDHIIPLNGENVCGLHVPWNLQYLPALENIRKSNKLIP